MLPSLIQSSKILFHVIISLGYSIPGLANLAATDFILAAFILADFILAPMYIFQILGATIFENLSLLYVIARHLDLHKAKITIWS